MQQGHHISRATVTSGYQILGNNFSAGGNNIFNINSNPSDETVERKKCLRALFVTSPTDDRAKHISFKGKIITATSTWITNTEAYRSWVDRSTGSRLLWISGGAGVGKTMLSIHLTEELEKIGMGKVTVLYYFCEGRDPKRNSPVNILRGMIYMLVRQKPQLIKHLLPDYEVQQEMLFSEDSIEPLWRIFAQMIHDPETGPVYCVVDGLDECAQTSTERVEHVVKKFTSFYGDSFGRQSGTDALAQGLQGMSLSSSALGAGWPDPRGPTVPDTSTPVFKLALISREEPECLTRVLSTFQRLRLGKSASNSVQGAVHVTAPEADCTTTTGATSSTDSGGYATSPDKADTSKRPSVVQDENAASYSESLSIYIQTKIADISEIKGYSEEAQQFLVDSLRRRGDGTFLWVDMAIKRMANTAVLESEQTISNLPSGTDGMHCLELLQIPQHVIAVAAFVLRWVAMAVRPLKLNELSALLYFLDSQPNGPILAVLEEAISCCGSLVDVSEEQELKLVHQTTKDLLTNPSSVLLRDPRLQHFFVNEKQTHAEIAQASISYLEKSPLDRGWYHMISLGTDPWTEETLEPDPTITENFPFLEYAVANWPEHMKKGTPGTIHFSSPFFSPGSNLRSNWFRSAWEITFRRDGELAPLFQSTLHIAAFFDLRDLAHHEARRPDFATRLEKRNGEFMAPASVAAMMGSVEVLDFLLNHGAKTTLFGEHIINTACRYGRLNAVRLLLDRGTDANFVATENMASKGARIALRHTPTKVFDMLAAVGEKNHQDLMHLIGQDYGTGITPLHNSVACGNEEVAKLLIIRGANVLHATSTGWTAVHMAAWAGQTNLIEILIQYRANARATTSTNWTALHCAAARGKAATGEYLVSYGLTVDALSKRSETPLHLASAHGHEAIARTLLAHGAQTEVTTSKGFTALHLAAQGGHDKVISSLLDYGANPDALSTSGQKPLQLAKGGKHSKTATLLQTYRSAFPVSPGPIISHQQYQPPLSAAVVNVQMSSQQQIHQYSQNTSSSPLAQNHYVNPPQNYQQSFFNSLPPQPQNIQATQVQWPATTPQFQSQRPNSFSAMPNLPSVSPPKLPNRAGSTSTFQEPPRPQQVQPPHYQYSPDSTILQPQASPYGPPPPNYYPRQLPPQQEPQYVQQSLNMQRPYWVTSPSPAFAPPPFMPVEDSKRRSTFKKFLSHF